MVAVEIVSTRQQTDDDWNNVCYQDNGGPSSVGVTVTAVKPLGHYLVVPN